MHVTQSTVAWGWMIVAVMAWGCAPKPTGVGFNAADPHEKIPHIIQAGQDRDRTAIPHLIEQLDSDDPAVRMYSIGALERITGTRLGFDYAQAPERRTPAVQRWIEAWESGEVARLVDERNKSATEQGGGSS